MTLSFSTTWPARMGELAGQPNYFIQKIWNGVIKNLGDSLDNILYQEKHYTKFGSYWSPETDQPAKLHTIREDPHNRWKPGMKIHPVINNRTKDRFQFAPEMMCVSVQEIKIEYVNEIRRYYTWTNIWGGGDKRVNVYIDGEIMDSNMIKQLAINDGFPSVEAFFQYFNTDFKGKLIHWTDLKY